MISYPLDAAKKSKLFDNIHVSTDSSEIKDVVENLGVPVEFMRSANLSDDKTPLMPVLQWVLNIYKARGQSFDTVCLVLPCAPLIEASDLIQAHDVFLKHRGKKPLMAVAPFPVPVEWAYKRNEDGSLDPVNAGAYARRSQDIGKKYYDAGTFYFYSTAHILTDQPVTDRDYVSYLLPRSKAVDIDDQEDLEFAAALFSARSRS